MASIYKFETRDDRIDRMRKNNPHIPIHECIAVVDATWKKRQEMLLEKFPVHYRKASLDDLGFKKKMIIDGLNSIFVSPDDGPVGLVFSGPVGSGKTHAFYATLRWVIERNPEILTVFSTFPEVIRELRREFTTGDYDEISSVWDKLVNHSGFYGGLLALDDLSCEKQTDFQNDKFLNFITHRVENHMPFILTTNVPYTKFKDIYGERIASRLLGFCEVIEFLDEDKRQLVNS